MTIKEIQNDIIDEFSMFDDWMQRYEYIIELGKNLPLIQEEFKTDDNLIKGCQSKVWLHASEKDGKIYLHADSDAVITKGIIALLIKVLNGQRAVDVEKADLHFIDAIGLKAHLSPTRSNGLTSMVQHIKSYARQLGEKKETTNVPEDYRDLMVREIKEIYDPEIPVDIWELGLIYTLDIDDEGKVNITMTLTSPACPVAGSLPLEVQERLLRLPFVKDVELKLVWDPAWNKERMSDEAKMALDMF